MTLDSETQNLLAVYRGLLEETEALCQLLVERGLKVPEARGFKSFPMGLSHVEVETDDWLLKYGLDSGGASYLRLIPIGDVEDLPWGEAA